MTNSAEQSPSSAPASDVTASDIYQVLTSLVMHAEQVRWSRLNTLLVMNSLFAAAWVGVLVGINPTTNPFPYKNLLLFLLCMPGVVYGALWTRLGLRSSDYMDDFHKKAFEMEGRFPNGIPMPFHLSEGRRETLRTSAEKFTSSKLLVATIPFVFAVFFVFLALLSFWR